MKDQKPRKSPKGTPDPGYGINKRTKRHSVSEGLKPFSAKKSHRKAPDSEYRIDYRRETEPGHRIKKEQKQVLYDVPSWKDKRTSKKGDSSKSRFTGKEADSVPLRLNSRGEPARPKSIAGKTAQYLKSKRPEKKEVALSPPVRFKKEAGTREAPPRNFIRERTSERKITYGKNTRELPLRNFKREEKPVIKDVTPEKDIYNEPERENNYIYGRHPVLEVLRNESAVNKVWIGEYTRDTSEIVEFLKEKGVPYKIVPRNKLNDLVGENTNHQGVVAEISDKEYTEFDDLIALCKVKSPFFIILDKVEDPHNLGAIIRTADAAGVDAIIIPKHKAVGLTGVVAKTAAGALQRMKVSRVANLAQAMDLLKKNNVWTVGVDMEGKENYSKANFKGSIALVLGGEGQGLSRLLKEKCDFVVNIPMQARANSLNVSVATAIMIYEVFRQKDFKTD